MHVDHWPLESKSRGSNPRASVQVHRCRGDVPEVPDSHRSVVDRQLPDLVGALFTDERHEFLERLTRGYPRTNPLELLFEHLQLHPPDPALMGVALTVGRSRCRGEANCKFKVRQARIEVALYTVSPPERTPILRDERGQRVLLRPGHPWPSGEFASPRHAHVC